VRVTPVEGAPQAAALSKDLKEVRRLGTLLFVLVVALVLAALIGAGGYSRRRYWSPAGTEVVEIGGDSMGAGAGIAAVSSPLPGAGGGTNASPSAQASPSK
jgi:hypothetical protein